jgi:Rrf2 family protein
MRLSRQAHYAFRTVLDLSRHGRVRSSEIARRQGIPPAFLGKVVQGLGRAGILRTFQGVRGGVELARAPAALTLRQVLEAAEGPLAINLCALWGDCPCLQPCPVRATLARAQAAVERELAVTFAELAGAGTGGRPRPAQAPAAPTAAGQTVTVKMSEFTYAIQPTEVAAGRVTFQIENVGTVEHDFLIEGTDTGTQMLRPGQSATLTVDLAPGTYTVFCNVAGHKEAGMHTQLVVK